MVKNEEDNDKSEIKESTKCLLYQCYVDMSELLVPGSKRANKNEYNRSSIGKKKSYLLLTCNCQDLIIIHSRSVIDLFSVETSTRVVAQLYTYNPFEMAEKTGLCRNIFNIDPGEEISREQENTELEVSRE